MNGAPRALAKAIEIVLLQADERPSDRHAVARGHDVHAAQPRDAGSAQQTKEHSLRLIVGVMSGHDRVGADRLGVIDEQTIAGLARAFLQAARRLRALPLKNAMADAEPRAKRRDRLRFVSAFGSKSVIDRRRLDPRLAAPLRPFSRHQEQRGRIGAAGDSDQKRLRRVQTERTARRCQPTRERASAERSTMILGAFTLGELLHRGRRGRVALAEFGQCRAGLLGIAKGCERLPEPHHAFRRPR